MTTNRGNSTASWSLERMLPSVPVRGSEFVRELVEQLERLQWPSKDIFGIHMAMEEAVMNAIKHGNCCEETKQVHVLIEIQGGEFYAKITDEGCGFNLSNVPDPRLEENVEKTTGRGVMLMKNFVDQVKYSEKGNVVELRKKRNDNP